MIQRVNRLGIFLFTFFFSFIVLLITLFSYFYSRNQKFWLREILSSSIFAVPLLVYLLLIAILVASFVSLVMFFYRKSQYGRIEEKVRLLAAGSYESPLLTRPIPANSEDEYIPDIDRELEKVRVKMIDMSKELQLLADQPRLIDGETKEEILEEERHRLARELHDSVSQQLFAAMMMLSAVNEQTAQMNLTETLKKQLAMINDIINNSQSEMRALLLHLRPTSLEGKSLKKGIEQLLVELQTKIQIHLTWDIADVSLNKGVEDHLFRIVQELLSNTLRHSKAKELEVYLQQTDQHVVLRMVDDGVGFNVDDQKVGSYGLKNIHERVISMGGTCKIISFQNQGTSVEIRIPVLKEEQISDTSIVSG